MSGGEYEIRYGDVVDRHYEELTASIAFMRKVVLPNLNGVLVEVGGLDGLEERVVQSHEHDPDAPWAKVHGVDRPQEVPTNERYHSLCLMYASGYIDAVGPLSPFTRDDARRFADHCASRGAAGKPIGVRWAEWSEKRREETGR